MADPKHLDAGDGAIQKLLNRYGCPTPFHVVRMRFWGEIVNPAQKVPPVKTIESFWPEGCRRSIARRKQTPSSKP